jgi:DNA-directed RNA polymerase specialized sigma24 family protein
VSGYDRALVEQLLPAVWDETFAYGMANPTAPDPDMPRSKPDPKTGGTLFAHLADIKRAWGLTDLAHEERVVLLLCWGLDWTQQEIADEQGVTQQAVSKRLERGALRLVAFLNGKACEETEDATA